MIVEFEKSFEKSLDKIKDKSIYLKIRDVIFELEKSSSIIGVVQIKKLVGYKQYYRYKLGDYRIGFE